MKDSDKTSLRRELRAKRRALAPAAVRAASAAVCARVVAFAAYREAASVTAYIAAENEIDPREVLDICQARRRPLYLPRLLDPPAVAPWESGEELIATRLGVLEPAAEPALPETPAIALLPVVGWDRSGTRLGRGAGYYDRLLRHYQPRPLCVGLAYAFQEVAQLPRDAWDIPLQFVITERELVRCSDAPAADLSERGGQA